MKIDPILYSGRPNEKRSPVEEACYDLLDKLGIAYFRVDHEHADTIEMCEEAEALLGCRICKNLFLTNRQQTDFYLLLMPGEKHSRIVPHFGGDIVTTPRSQAQYLVTEYGAAMLAGQSTWQRAELLVSLAHPDFRDELIRAAEEQRIWLPSNKR